MSENTLYRPGSTELAPASIPRKAPGASLEQGYDHYLLQAPDGKRYRLNTQSAALFEMCDGISSVNQIIQILQAAFPDAARDIRMQVMDTLTELRAQGAVELVTDATGDAGSRNLISDPSRTGFVVASYVTENTPYEREVENLTRSCKRWGLRHVVIKYRDRGGYHNNVRIMPEFFLRVMDEHPGMDVLYLDADCVIEAYPDLLTDFQADVGFWYDYRDGAPSIHAGTIYMKNKRETRALLRHWIKLLAENPKLTEEEVVRMACMEGEMDVDDWLRGFGLSFSKLPQSYVHNYDAPLIGKAVIEHYCSGRRLHIKTDKNIHDPFLWAAPNIVCIKAGGGEKYTAEYVNRLHAGIHKNFTRSFRFVCLTDDHRGLDRKIEVFPLPDASLSGWWHKLSLFMPEVYDLQGLIWYFDLDQVVIENIDCFMDIEGEFLSIPDPSWPGEFNTSIMRFRVGRYPQIWESFKRNKNIMKEDCSDQNWINLCGNMRTSDDVGIKTRRLQEKFPQYMPATQLIESFPAEWINIYDSDLVGKSGAIKGIDRPEHISSDCRIVVCYGYTSLPHNTWLREYW